MRERSLLKITPAIFLFFPYRIPSFGGLFKGIRIEMSKLGLPVENMIALKQIHG